MAAISTTRHVLAVMAMTTGAVQHDQAAVAAAAAAIAGNCPDGIPIGDAAGREFPPGDAFAGFPRGRRRQQRAVDVAVPKIFLAANISPLHMPLCRCSIPTPASGFVTLLIGAPHRGPSKKRRRRRAHLSYPSISHFIFCS